MQLSTNLPTSLKEYERFKRMGGVLIMNVSIEADAEFMRLLERDNVRRYENLIGNMQLSVRKKK